MAGNLMSQGQGPPRQPYGSQQHQAGPGMDWEIGRRGSGGSMGSGVSPSQLPGGSQRGAWSEDGDSFESETLGHGGHESEHQSELGSPQQDYEGLRRSPPLELEYDSSHARSSHIVTPPTQSQSMSTSLLASASKAKPSFVQLHSRSVSLDYPVDEIDEGSSAPNGHSSTSNPSPPMETPTYKEDSALMDEFSKLQSAVESYSIQRQGRDLEEPIKSLQTSPLKSPSPYSPPKSFESLSPLPSPISLIQSPGDSPLSPDSKFPQPRKAIVVQEYELDNEYKSSTDEESDSDSEEEHGVVGTTATEGLGFYDHSPGEVYTIHEEEDEGGSPTGGDLVTSLSRSGIQGPGDLGSPRRRMMAQECLPGQMLPPEHRHGARPQLRPQRSLDNRLFANQQAGMEAPLDPHGNTYNNNVNAHAQNQVEGSGLVNRAQLPSTSSLLYHHQHPTEQYQPQQTQQSLQSYGPTPHSNQQLSSRVGSQPHQHQHQQGPMGQNLGQQKPVENLIEWNNNMGLSTQGQQSLTGPIASTGVIAHEQMSGVTSQNQPYQPPSSSTANLQSNLISQHNQSLPLQQQQQQIPQSLSQQFPPMSQLQPQQSQYSSQQQQQADLQFQHNVQAQQNLQGQQSLQAQQNLQAHQNLQAQQNLQDQQNQQLQQQQTFLQQQLHYQQQMQIPSSTHQQLGPGTSELTGYSAEPWSAQPQQTLYDANGRPISNQNITPSQFSQNQQLLQQNLAQQQYQQQQPINAQQQQQGLSPLPQHPAIGGMGAPGQQTPHLGQTNAGPGQNKSISGLLADFSRALGLGSTSPRPSPSDDKSELFPSGLISQDQSLSPYEQYFQPQGNTAQSQQQFPNIYTSPQQPIQQSAFTSIQDLNQVYIQQQHRQSNIQQQYPFNQNQPTSTQQQLGMQGIQYVSAAQGRLAHATHSPTPSAQSQQYIPALHPHSSPQVLTQAGIMTPQQAASLGVGVVGALSPAQAHMYQQQMALQHQAQHMKKTSRRAHLTGTGDIRRDGTSTVLIGGQSLAMGSGGMTIGALTPAVVTSLGTFIGGGPAILTSSLLQQPLAVTPLGTPVGTPRSGRDAGDSSDTMSETDSQKSLRMRRKLPCLPPDQEAAPLPSTKKRDRQRAMEFRSLSPIRTSFEMSGGRSYPLPNLGLSRPSASESNLRKMVSMVAPDHVPRPGSALGLLQGSSVVSSIGGKMDSVYPLCGNLFSTSSVFPSSRLRTVTSGLPSSGGDFTTTTSVLSGLYPSYKASDNWSSNMAELAACLPPDLRHLLNKEQELGGLGDLSSITASLGESSLGGSSQLPSYIKTIREQLQEERRQLLTEERRRLEALRERDRELGARVDAVTNRAGGGDSFRSRADLSRNVGISRSAGASPLMSRKLKGHHRQLSDPKLSLPFSPIQEDGELQDFDRGAGILKYNSYESYGSLDDVLGGDWDHSQSYLASSWAAAGGVLRETAINNMGSGHECEDGRSRGSRFLSRRNSDGESYPLLSTGRSSSSHRRHHLRKHRKSRSWNPSPYVSEEEEEEEEDLSREEKKTRIKAEIARRRQQLQERAGLHQELVRISRLREGPETEKHSVLKSVDQLLRDQYSYHDSMSFYGGRSAQRRDPGGIVISPCASEEDKSIELIASTFRSDDYTSLLYEKLGEMSPMAESEMGSELGNMAAMPLLEDMPTRSRRLLEDLSHRTDGGGQSGRGSLKGRSHGDSEEEEDTPPSLQSSNNIMKFPSGKYCPKNSPSRDRGVHEPHRVKSKSLPICANGNTSPSSIPDSLNRMGAEESPSRRPSSAVSSFCKYPFDTKRILLTKDPKDISSAGNSLGLKIVGGKELPFSGGRIAAYVAKIFNGPETVGDVKEGDVVLEWNDITLDNKTFEEVQTIVGKPEGEVEVLLRCNYNILTGKARATGRDFTGYESSRDSDGNITITGDTLRPRELLDRRGSEKSRTSGPPPLRKASEPSIGIPSEKCLEGNNGGGEIVKRINDREAGYELTKSPSTSTDATNTSVGTNSIHRQLVTVEHDESTRDFPTMSSPIPFQKKRSPSQPIIRKPTNGLVTQRRKSGVSTKPTHGHVQLQICHDPKASVLYVTVIKAKLPKQLIEESSDLQIDPYIVVYLLPNRVIENQRRTRHVHLSFAPVWNQTMVYPNITLSELMDKLLEITVWNYNDSGDDEVLGKINLLLSAEGILDEQPHLYQLQMDEGKCSKPKGRPRFEQCTPSKKTNFVKRSSESASSRCSFLTASDRRSTTGRLSLFSPSNIPAKTALPSDCHGSCVIL